MLMGLDAGFFTARNIRPRFLQHICSMAFTIFYLVFPESAEEKVRKFRAVATPEMMRLSWEKAATPILRLITALDRGYLNIREDITISRPKIPGPTSFPDRDLGEIKARLYFSGTRRKLRECRELLFMVPGGGFVTMNPKCHDDYVSQWARQTGLPIVSINYGKAPAYPYPWGLEECFDAYKSIVESNGQVIGMSGWTTESGRQRAPIKIVVFGDSAGGNIVAGMVIKVIESGLPIPAGLVLIYPVLSFDMACWMPQGHINLIRQESSKDVPAILDAKSYEPDNPLQVPEAPRGIDVLSNKVDWSQSWYKFGFFSKKKKEKERVVPNSLSMTSRMSYFTDPLIAPEFLRAMALLYLGSSPVSYNFEDEYYLSPVVAPDDILAKFPRTFFITGERDPLVDDTVIFASRLRKAKQKKMKERLGRMSPQMKSAAVGTSESHKLFMEIRNRANEEVIDFVDSTSEEDLDKCQPRVSLSIDEMVRVRILEGISHAFFTMYSILPEARQATQLLSDWFLELMDDNRDESTEFMLDVVEEEAIFRRRLDELADVHKVH